MKKVLILAIAAVTVWLILSSCRGYDICPTYANSSLKQYNPIHTVHAPAKIKAKKDTKTKIW